MTQPSSRRSDSGRTDPKRNTSRPRVTRLDGSAEPEAHLDRARTAHVSRLDDTGSSRPPESVVKPVSTSVDDPSRPVIDRNFIPKIPAQRRNIADHIDTDKLRGSISNLRTRFIDGVEVVVQRGRSLLNDGVEWVSARTQLAPRLIIFSVVGFLGAALLLWVLIATITPRAATGLLPTPTNAAIAAQPKSTDVPLNIPLNVSAWNGGSRYTILLMGLDKRPGEEGTGFRTDSILLISIDPTRRTVGILSIPRDLRVPIPGQTEMMPINTLYVTGELQRPGYGPNYLAEALRYNLGMKIDAHVAVSFNAVIELVDAIGGIDVLVPEKIDDPEFPAMIGEGYDPLYIPAGTVHMDGLLALKYARVRHVGLDDYDRARRQQQVILAIRQALLNPGKLADVLPRSPSIWNAVRSNIVTDLDLSQMLSLGLYLKDIDTSAIQRGTLDGDYLQPVQDPVYGYPQVTINRNNIQELLTAVFGANYIG